MREKTYTGNSFKHKLLFYNGVLFLTVLVIIFITNLRNLESLKSYQAFTRQFTDLTDFYEQMSLTDSYAKNYLYTQEESSFAVYRESLENARERLQDLKLLTADPGLKWKYEKLGNMVLTYEEVFQRLCENQGMGEASYSETYEFFVHLPDNIAQTYMEYSTLITREMHAERGRLMEEWNIQIRITVGVVALMSVGAVLFSAVLLRSITRPIQGMVRNAERMQRGDYELEKVYSRDRELGVLCQAMENMGTAVRDNLEHEKEKSALTRKLLEKENENLKINEMLMETELKVLQGQINPHFLFNTLSMLSRVAYLEQAEETRQLMEITAELLRYSLDKAGGTSDLQGEISCVKNYLEIQKRRFGSRVAFSFSAEEGLPNIRMPGMIIQPLIENAVLHGVGDMMEDAYVEVSVFRKGDQIGIQVEDNGKGMDSDLVEALLQNRTSELEDRQKSRSIGVGNVKRRLEMFYGKQRLLQIESSPGCGTVMLLWLPILQEGEEEHVSAVDCGG